MDPINVPSMIALDKIARRHPEHVKYSAAWLNNWRIFQGGQEIEMASVLKRFYKENQEDFDYRTATTPFLNFAKKMLEFPVNKVFTEPLKRQNVEGIPVDNTDGIGTGLSQITKNCLILSRSIGKMIVLVDRDLKKSNKPYCTLYLPGNMINWKYDNQGGFDWVIFEEINTYQESIIDDPITVFTYRYWSKAEIIVWQYTSKDTTLRMVDGFPKMNLRKTVPVVIFDNQVNFSNLKFTSSECFDLYKVNNAILSTISAWLLNIQLQNGILVLPDDNIDSIHAMSDSKIDINKAREEQKRKLSINSAIEENAETNGITRIVAPSNTIPQHIESVTKLLELMKEFSSIGNMDVRQESGISKSYRYDETKAMLDNVANYAEIKDAEICFHLANFDRETARDAYKTSIEREFDIVQITNEINDLLNIEKTLLANSKTFMTEFLKKKVNRLTDSVPAATYDQIVNEVIEFSENIKQVKVLNAGL